MGKVSTICMEPDSALGPLLLARRVYTVVVPGTMVLPVLASARSALLWALPTHTSSICQ